MNIANECECGHKPIDHHTAYMYIRSCRCEKSRNDFTVTQDINVSNSQNLAQASNKNAPDFNAKNFVVWPRKHHSGRIPADEISVRKTEFLINAAMARKLGAYVRILWSDYDKVVAFEQIADVTERRVRSTGNTKQCNNAKAISAADLIRLKKIKKGRYKCYCYWLENRYILLAAVETQNVYEM